MAELIPWLANEARLLRDEIYSMDNETEAARDDLLAMITDLEEQVESNRLDIATVASHWR